MTAIVFLALFVFAADGSVLQHQQVEQPTLDRCWQEARGFVKNDPAKFHAAALGAGCIVKKGEPA